MFGIHVGRRGSTRVVFRQIVSRIAECLRLCHFCRYFRWPHHVTAYYGEELFYSQENFQTISDNQGYLGRIINQQQLDQKYLKQAQKPSEFSF